MVKHKIIFETGWSGKINLFGISCHLKDYRFCWLLNKQFDIDLRRVCDFYPGGDGEQPPDTGFPFFNCEEKFRDEIFYLLGNHSAGGDLLSRHTQLDYLLFIRDLAFPGGTKAVIQEIKKIPQLITVFEITEDKRMNIPSLITELEICLLEYRLKLKKHQETTKQE